MKNIFRLGLILLLCAISPSGLAAQETVKKKVAVYVTGSDVDSSIKKVLGAKIVTAITQSGEFAAVERTSEFLAALSQETDYQTSGEVRDSQIARLGQKFGVKYVAVADVSEAFDELFVAARLINVETGLVEKAYDVNGPAESMQQLISLSKLVADGLLSGLSRNSGGYGHGNDRMSTGGGQVETFTVNGVTFEMVRVDGGAMTPFYIGKTEVTQRLWFAVMGNNPSQFLGDNNPVERVSWYDCQEFVERLSRLTGKNFRLPTEREWEYAAKGGNKSRGYEYSGSNDVYRVAWYEENSGSRTHPVAQKLDNELGIYDMSGNVWEWCSDTFNGDSSFRVVRGGGWYDTAPDCRVAYRFGGAPGYRGHSLGLRLAL